jgi:CIC family chloride channel protein
VDERSGLPGLALLSLAAGAVTGLVGAVFRLSLDRADQFRDALVAWAHRWGIAGLVLVTTACASATAVAAWMVRRISPYASGSGIPHVEAVLAGELSPAPVSLVPVKFAGGVLAIGSGLALGREGPSVQRGASLACLVGVVFRRDRPDCRALLAAAFNAPIAGAVFVLEELVRRFETRTAVAALGASATAITVSRLFLGDVPDFTVDPLAFRRDSKAGRHIGRPRRPFYAQLLHTAWRGWPLRNTLAGATKASGCLTQTQRPASPWSFRTRARWRRATAPVRRPRPGQGSIVQPAAPPRSQAGRSRSTG